MRGPALTLACAALAAGCAGEAPWSVEAGQARPLVAGGGDQLHPAVQGDWVVWLDIAECEGTCPGRVRSLDLRTGEARTLSNELALESAPAVAGDLAAWRCEDAGGRGLCLSPLDRAAQRFLPEIGWDDYRNELGVPLAVSGRTLVWPRYRHTGGATPYQLMKADLDSGVRQALLALPSFPAAWSLAGRRAAWVTTAWTEDGYRSRLETLDLDTLEQRLVLETDQVLFGLAADGELLAWKQGTRQAWEDGEDAVHVFYLDGGGQIRQADGPEARVSEESAVVAGGGALYWLDYREGVYRLAGYDLARGQEELVTPEEAVLGAYRPPAAWGPRLVWPDRRGGDWDLYLLAR